MGEGVELDSPEHAQLIDDFKDQLLIVLVQRLGEVSISVEEVDKTGAYVLTLSLKDRVFYLEAKRKQ